VLWAVIKTTHREGKGWDGAHQIDYDKATVALLGIYVSHNGAKQWAKDGERRRPGGSIIFS
jgi:hypothetical protein